MGINVQVCVSQDACQCYSTAEGTHTILYQMKVTRQPCRAGAGVYVKDMRPFLYPLETDVRWNPSAVCASPSSSFIQNFIKYRN